MRTKRIAHNDPSVGAVIGKLDSQTFQVYFEQIWREISIQRKLLFENVDSLWFSLYRQNSTKAKVLGWIKKKEIFSRRYVLVPIVIWNHWSLLILCNFGENPTMLLLDSLQKAEHRLQPEIRKFVMDVYMMHGRSETDEQIRKIPFLIPKVPQQRDDVECGYYVLFYIKLFVEGAPETFCISTGYPFFMKEDWFTPEDVNELRAKLIENSAEQGRRRRRTRAGPEQVPKDTQPEPQQPPAPNEAQHEDCKTEQQEFQKIEPQVPTTQRVDRDGCTEEKKKNVRGGTYKIGIWGRPDNMPLTPIDFDKDGQPVGPHKNDFVEFLGSLARAGKYVPLDVKDWRHMPKDRLDDMIAVVKARFEVPPGVEGWIFKSIAKKWRTFKSLCKEKYYDPMLPYELQVANRDPRVVEDQWRALLMHWGTEHAIEQSEKNKEIRARKKMNHTTGKRSFHQVAAQLGQEIGNPPSRAKLFKKCYSHKDGTPSGSEVAGAVSAMEDRIAQLSHDCADVLSKDDIYAQVMGAEKSNRVRMMGLGVTPNDVWRPGYSKNIPYRLYMEQQAQLEAMKKRLDEQEERMAKMQSTDQDGKSNGSPITPSSDSSQQLPNSCAARRSLVVNASVNLQSMIDPTIVVAKGFVVSMDPSKEVFGSRLGKNFCEVNVQVPIRGEEQLVRPTTTFETIGDVIGIGIAWPCHLVTRDN